MADPSSHMWYVKAAGGVWGPYPEARVAGFVAEGRVGPGTAVSPWAAGPFAPAEASAEFAPLFKPGAAEAAASAPASIQAPRPTASGSLALAVQPSPQAAHAPAAIPEAAAAAHAGPLRALLVWAQLSGPVAKDFGTALGGFGPTLAIRPGLWLVQARTGAANLRNLLSRRLGAEDALLVVEAPLDHAAWFNLDPARDRELRKLWGAASQ